MALSFALAKEGLSAGQLDTKASVRLEQDGAGWKVTRSDLSLDATIEGIDPARFAEIAGEAKANCPISRLLDAEISLEHRLNGA
jgi:osmotically inducible protein OsmC